MHLWDSATRQEVGNYLEWDENFRFSPDGRRLLTTVEPDEKEPFRPVLWDLATHRRVAELPVEMLPDVGYRYVLATFAPDGHWLVTWHEHERDGRTLEVWDSATGRRLGRHDLHPKYRRSLVLAPDAAGLAVIDWTEMNMRGGTGTFGLTMLDMPSAKVRWRREFTRRKTRLAWEHPQGEPGLGQDDFHFAADGSILSIFSAAEATWEFLDARTGQSLHTAHILAAGTACHSATNDPVAPDVRRFWFRASLPVRPPRFLPAWAQRWLPGPRQTTLTLLLDGTSGAELGRLQTPGRVTSVSPDGSLVLSERYLDDNAVAYKRIQAWTVPPGRRWLWIVGIPLVVGAGLLMLRRWRSSARGPVP